jgi:DNA-binding XRE family transcriptional regulator
MRNNNEINYYIDEKFWRKTMKDFILEIKLARLRLGMLQKDLAQKINLKRESIQKLEAKKVSLSNITLGKFIKICESLDEEFRQVVLQPEYILNTFREVDSE